MTFSGGPNFGKTSMGPSPMKSAWFLAIISLIMCGWSSQAADAKLESHGSRPQIHLSGWPERRNEKHGFENPTEITAFVSLGNRLGKKGDVIRAEWVGPDGDVLETTEIKLKHILFPGQFLRFWISLSQNTSFTDDIGFWRTGESASALPNIDGGWRVIFFLNDSALVDSNFTVATNDLASH